MHSFKIKSRIWIETENGMFLGNGRVQLLKAIEETGSLTKAAKSLNMSYKKAWNLVDSVNKNAAEEVVSTNVGGKDGGGAIVTGYGKILIQKFDDLNAETIAFLNEKTNQFEK
jgi:molybdate transport system regulatory protein